jgi:heat shock protein HtpX
MHRIPQQDLRASSELQAYFIFPAGAGKSLSNLFSTPPPLEKRLERLMRLESQLQGAAV